MARVFGGDANFSFNAIAIEGELNSIGISFDVGSVDITAFADTWQVPLAGKKSTQIEIAGTVDPVNSAGVDTLFDAIQGGPLSTVFDPTGSGPGANNPEYLCTASGLTGTLVAGLRINYAVADAARYSATLQNSGSTTRAVA